MPVTLGRVEKKSGDSIVCDIVKSPKRGRIIVTKEDMATLRQMKQNPPKPTPELVAALAQYKEASAK